MILKQIKNKSVNLQVIINYNQPGEKIFFFKYSYFGIYFQTNKILQCHYNNPCKKYIKKKQQKKQHTTKWCFHEFYLQANSIMKNLLANLSQIVRTHTHTHLQRDCHF